MTLIQLALILGLFASLAVYLTHFRSITRDRIIAVLLFTCAVTTVLFPPVAGHLAAFAGVGRGVDFVLYISVVTAIFWLVLLYSRIHSLQRMITEIVRDIALHRQKDLK